MAVPLRDDLPTRQVPWLTMALIGINVVVFLFVQPAVFQRPAGGSVDTAATDSVEAEEFLMRWAAVPCEVVSGLPLADAPDRCDAPPTTNLPDEKSIPLSLLTAMFLHANKGRPAGRTSQARTRAIGHHHPIVAPDDCRGSTVAADGNRSRP